MKDSHELDSAHSRERALYSALKKALEWIPSPRFWTHPDGDAAKVALLRTELSGVIDGPAPCPRCKGRGTVPQDCPDPQCGDSTWDHPCQAGSARCPDCE